MISALCDELGLVACGNVLITEEKFANGPLHWSVISMFTFL